MVSRLLCTHDPIFCSLSWFIRCKEHPCLLSPNWGFEGLYRFSIGVWHLGLDLDMFTGLWYTRDPNSGSLSWSWRCKEHPCPLSLHFGLWRTLEVPDWGLASWSCFGYGQWSLMHPYSKFVLSILILKVQRISMSFKSLFGALGDAGGSWIAFCILILIWICSPIFWILALCLDFEGAKNIHVLLVLIWGFGGHLTFLTGV